MQRKRVCRLPGRERNAMAGHPFVKSTNSAFIYVDHALTSAAQTISKGRCLDLAQSISAVIDTPFVDVSPTDPKRGFCLDASFKKITDEKRRCLIICGGLLEGAITQIAITALLDVYDVFLVDDLCFTAQPSHRHLFINRDKDCGASIVTGRQVLHDVSGQQPNDLPPDVLKNALDRLPI